MTVLGVRRCSSSARAASSRGGRGIAAELGMSERMLGLTVIALGTALPELIGSIVAAHRAARPRSRSAR